MRHFPVFLDLKEVRCLVVGGGEVAKRKCMSLLSTGAEITCVSRVISGELMQLLKERHIEFYERPFKSSDLDQANVVFAATDDNQLNHDIHDECKKRKLLVNVADNPQLCSFIMPAVLRRGNLQIAVSTSGKCPALSKKIKKELERSFDESYTDYLDLLGVVRSKIIESFPDEKTRKNLINTLVNLNLLELIRNDELNQATSLANQLLDKS